MNVPPMEPIKSQDKSDINEERNMVNEIDCSRPQDYYIELYEDREIIHLWLDEQEGQWLVVFDCGGTVWISDASLIKKKPQFKPEVGKWYEFSDDHDFTDAAICKLNSIVNERKMFVDNYESWFTYCRPIPQSIKEMMVFSEEKEGE